MFRPFPGREKEELKFIKQIHTVADGRMLIITYLDADWYDSNGQTAIGIYDPAGETMDAHQVATSTHLYNTVFLDRAGTLWIGTSGSGAYFGDTIAGRFELYRHEPHNPSSLSSNFVRAVHVDADGTVWVGHWQGVDRVDRSDPGDYRVVRNTVDLGEPGAKQVQSICRDRTGHLWVAVAGGGLSRFGKDLGDVERFRHDPLNPSTLSSDLASVVFEDSGGDLWVGTIGSGLNRLRPEGTGFDRFLQGVERPWARIVTLYEDAAGNLWIGTRRGLGRFDPASESVLRYGPDLLVPGIMMDTAINAIVELPDQPGVLWLGTGQNGLVRFDTGSGQVGGIDRGSHGLPDNEVNGLLADDSGRLWISTQRGFACFDPLKGTMRTFGPARGLQSLEFNRKAFHRGPGGEMFFGGVGGLNSFFPEAMIDNPRPPGVVLEKITVSDRSRLGGDDADLILTGPGIEGEPLFLRASQRDLTFEFTALHFTDPERNQYLYLLEGYDSTWRDPGKERSARYTNLLHGDYTFRVKAANAHGVWSTQEAAFSFVIRKPLWQEPWFLGLAVVFLAGLIFVLYAWKMREHRVRQEEMEQLIAKRTGELQETLAVVESQRNRLGELDKARSRFVANISHELRTPLTLVFNPLKDLLDGVFGAVPRKAHEEMEVAVRNAGHLQRLVEQLLLVARLEAGQMKLLVEPGDLAGLLSEIVTRFTPLAERKQIDLGLDITAQTLHAWFDVDRLEMVFANLLSNALKFTPEGGTVRMRAGSGPDGEGFVVEVEDDGPGIAADKLPYVFDRFFQVDEKIDVGQPGTGIGLALAKDLVELHGGQISVESRTGVGSTFTVALRAGQGHFQASLVEFREDVRTTDLEGIRGAVRGDSESEDDTETNTEPSLDDRATILVAEDNLDMRNLLVKRFARSYRVITAGNGLEAMALIRDELPDLVISDVMMPEMDGYSLCRAIKSDPHLEFIPVILLTARAEVSDRISGLEGGADDYMVKPFDSKELYVRVANLLRLRHRLKTRFAQVEPLADPDQGFPSTEVEDSGFLRRVRKTIEGNLSDDRFGVEELASKLNMSRVHLYRLVKGETDRTPAELIMDYRLEHAAQLLANKAGTISEVAYGVGFKSLSHFSRRFSKRYGISPTAFRSKSPESKN